jgi:hypothetical protein
MRIQKNSSPTGAIVGYTLWLSANDTYHWATRPHMRWPCSDLSGNRLMVYVDSNGLCDMTINGEDGDCSGNELDAIIADHLPADCRHLWPCWGQIPDHPVN